MMLLLRIELWKTSFTRCPPSSVLFCVTFGPSQPVLSAVMMGTTGRRLVLQLCTKTFFFFSFLGLHSSFLSLFSRAHWRYSLDGFHHILSCMSRCVFGACPSLRLCLFLSIIINYYFAIFSLSGRKPHATKVIFLEKIMILFVNLL